jgi:hypothetical protein
VTLNSESSGMASSTGFAPGEKRHGYITGLIYWRDPKLSAIVLALGIGFFTLTVIFRYSYTALFCMLFFVHLLISVSARGPFPVFFVCALPFVLSRTALDCCGSLTTANLNAAWVSGLLQLCSALAREEGQRVGRKVQDRQGRGRH